MLESCQIQPTKCRTPSPLQFLKTASTPLVQAWPSVLPEGRLGVGLSRGPAAEQGPSPEASQAVGGPLLRQDKTLPRPWLPPVGTAGCWKTAPAELRPLGLQLQTARGSAELCSLPLPEPSPRLRPRVGHFEEPVSVRRSQGLPHRKANPCKHAHRGCLETGHPPAPVRTAHSRLCPRAAVGGPSPQWPPLPGGPCTQARQDVGGPAWRP